MKDWNKKINDWNKGKKEAKFQKRYFWLFYILNWWNLHLGSISHEAFFLDGVRFRIELFINKSSLIDILINVTINLIYFYF